MRCNRDTYHGECLFCFLFFVFVFSSVCFLFFVLFVFLFLFFIRLFFVLFLVFCFVSCFLFFVFCFLFFVFSSCFFFRFLVFLFCFVRLSWSKRFGCQLLLRICSQSGLPRRRRESSVWRWEKNMKDNEETLFYADIKTKLFIQRLTIK